MRQIAGISAKARAKLAVEDDDPDGNVSFALAVSTAILVFLTSKLVLSQEDNHPIYFLLLGMSCAVQSQARARRATLPAS